MGMQLARLGIFNRVGAEWLDHWNRWSPKIERYAKKTGVLWNFLRDVHVY